MHVLPYLFFDGRCAEALEFYKKAVGATVDTLMHWKDAPDKSMVTPKNADRVMHAHFRIGDSAVLGSDGEGKGHPKFEGFRLVIHAKDETEADNLFTALADGGKVTMPLTKTFFSPKFGMLNDKFGVGWMVLVDRKS